MEHFFTFLAPRNLNRKTLESDRLVGVIVAPLVERAGAQCQQ